MNFLEIQPLTADLLPAAVELDQVCFGGLWSLEGYQREVESPCSDLLIVRESSAFSLLSLGCLWAILEEAHITILAVHPAYQRQGLGQAMLYVLMVAAWRRKLEWLTLEVRVSNQTAIALYHKFGFRDVGHRRNYYQDTGEDALILWKKELQHPEFYKMLRIWYQEVCDRLEQTGWYFSDASQYWLDPDL
jgi:ribosomal-protein-alanine N-acetyltransferase